jgi:hypothetical protein
MEENTIQPVEETTETTPSLEQTESTAEVNTVDTEVASDAGVEGATESTNTEEEAKRSPRQEKRFAKMSNKIRELSEQTAQQDTNYFGSDGNAYQNPYQQPYQDVNQGLDYNQEVARQAEMIADLKLQQFEQKQQVKQIADNFERDVDVIERKYQELNADSDSYDSALSNKIASMYEKLSAKNPDIRLKDIVDDVMEVATRQSANATAKVSAKVAQTAAESTLKPDTSAQGSDSKDFSDLSLKEMEEQLGFNQ